MPGTAINHAPDHQRPYTTSVRFVLASLHRVGRLRALGTVIEFAHRGDVAVLNQH